MRPVSFYVLLFVIVLCRSSAQLDAQNSAAISPISGASLGFVVDGQFGTVREVRGIPGAASLSGPIGSFGQLDSTRISPSHDYVLGNRKDSDAPLLFTLTSGETAGVRLPTSQPVTAEAVFSPNGSAILMPGTDGVLAVLTGMPRSPKPSGHIDVRQIGGRAGSMAVSDDGASVLLASVPDTGEVYLWRSDAGLRRVASGLGGRVVVQYLTNSHDSLIADVTNNNVYRLASDDPAASPILMAGPEDGINGPVGVAASSDNRFAYVANSVSHSVTVLEFSGAKITQVACICQVSTLERMKGRSMFRLSSAIDSTIWLFDGDGDATTPRVVGVPGRTDAALAAADPNLGK